MSPSFPSLLVLSLHPTPFFTFFFAGQQREPGILQASHASDNCKTLGVHTCFHPPLSWAASFQSIPFIGGKLLSVFFLTPEPVGGGLQHRVGPGSWFLEPCAFSFHDFWSWEMFSRSFLMSHPSHHTFCHFVPSTEQRVSFSPSVFRITMIHRSHRYY